MTSTVPWTSYITIPKMKGAGEKFSGERETIRRGGRRGEAERERDRLWENCMERAICKGPYRSCDLWQRDSVSSKQLISEGAGGTSLFCLLKISSQVYSICWVPKSKVTHCCSSFGPGFWGAIWCKRVKGRSRMTNKRHQNCM